MNESIPSSRIEHVVAVSVARERGRPDALLQVLHDVQEQLGCVPAQAVPPIARALNLSRAEVHGVLTFYHHFRREPPGRHVLRICQAEACRSMGAAALTAHAQRRLGCNLHETSADGAFTLEPAYCLGLCALSPAASIDDEVHARLTPARLDGLLAAVRGDATPASETA